MVVDINSETGTSNSENHNREKRNSLIKDLLQRRVPQILGIYLATSWAIIEFLDWLVNRYTISPHLPEFGMVILASMIPTVLLVAYFHGKPGRDKWTGVERIGIPTNALGTIILLFFLFKGQELGATTTMISLKNEEGQTIERVITKSEFRKKIMIFFLENESGDTALNWLSYGIIDMMSTDLVQDHYIDVRTGYNQYSNDLDVIDKMKEAGYPTGIGLPLMLEKEIADNMHMNYFMSGSFTKQEEGLTLNSRLYDTKNGKLIKENTFVKENIFELVDEMVVQLKHDLEIPVSHIDEAVDLPIAEISTNSITAYRIYIAGMNALLFNQEWEKARYHLEQSVREDSTFSLAYLNLYHVYMFTNQIEKMAWLFQSLLQHLYKLPEKLQFHAKASYYEFKKEYDKQYAIFEMLVGLYPEDIRSRLNLAQIYIIKNQFDEAIAEYEYILELDPEQYDILREIGGLYIQKGKFEDALDYYKLYADQFPDKPESFRSIGGLYMSMGDFKMAQSYYEQSLLIEPENISDLLSLAEIELETGNFDQALKQYHEALEKSNTPYEKADVYAKLQEFYELTGQMSKEIEYLHLKFTEQEKYTVPLYLSIGKVYSMNRYVKLEKKEIVFQILEDLQTQLFAPLDKILYVGYLYLYLELEDIDNAKMAISRIEELIEQLKVNALQPVVINARGKINEIRAEYEQAIRNYQEVLILEPTASGVNLSIGRCYRKIQDLKKAEEYVQKTLAIHTYWPGANYEMALIYYDMGKKKEALEYLKKTLQIWKNADPEHKKATEARELLNDWEAE